MDLGGAKHQSPRVPPKNSASYLSLAVLRLLVHPRQSCHRLTNALAFARSAAAACIAPCNNMDLRHSDNSGDAASSAGLRTIFDDAFLAPHGSEGFSALDLPVMEEGSPVKHEVGSASKSKQPLKRDIEEDDFDGEEFTDKALRRRKALQEKSKRAQRRYRERKKAETEELKKHIEDLSSRLTSLSAENSSLQNRNSLLEKVVQIRGNGDASVSAEAVPVGNRGGAGLSSHVVSAATFLGLVYPGRGLEKTIRKEHLNSMTTADFVKVWQDYLNKLTHLLLAAEGDASGGAASQIQELVGAQRWAVQEFAQHDLAKLMRMSVDVRRGRLQEQHASQLQPQRSEGAMRRTLEILGLSHEQKLRIVDLRCRFLGCMREVLQERAELQGALARPMPARFDGSAAMSAFAETSVDVEARVQALVARQGDAFRLMMYGVREALTPMQDAQLLVDAFPYHPDPCALAKLIAEELHHPCASTAVGLEPHMDSMQCLLPGMDFLDSDDLGKDFLGPTVTTGYM